ncbi:hypothetical protein GCM10027275_36160 [Rhabdobacter roseus]|uniref:Uncharacterized protein n=1 Tax=Rhabdobacter roseus TaxID=1655419 RepID=A0A840U0S3_9BACT|nr:hypothetical protein [Rhabdobacter roseus]MBB5285978.1 hypothetical protein [Rhabdobacter roseus]
MNFEDFSFDPEDDFDAQGGSRQPGERRDRDEVFSLPIMKKAKDIYQITRALVELIDEEKDEFMTRQFMLENASLLASKIAGAEGGNLYSLRMENAVIIKLNARELLTQTSVLLMEENVNKEYVDLLRQAIEEFRLLFIDWVSTFDKGNDIPDGWGNLFG